MRTRRASSFAAVALAALAAMPGRSVAAGQPAALESPVFTESAAAMGVRFRHVAGRTPEKNMIETMGSGVCFLDYDGDGDADLFFVQSGPVPGASGTRTGHVLYRNDGKGRFTDVSAAAGVAGTGYGMGCAAADFDNDGDQDLYVTQFGPNLLYRNNGNGTFSEGGGKAGVAYPLWSTSAAFADYDADGRLDLFVANYVDFAMNNNKWCGDSIRKIRAYCHPDAYEGVPDVLYHNNGDGTFTDVTKKAGLTERWGKGLGAVFSDLDDDGDLDLYVAKDSVPNALYRNNGNGTFTDVTLDSGTGYSEDGKPEAGMGTDAGDYDGDGRFDLFVVHLSGEVNELYRNLGGLRFEVATYPAGIAEVGVLWVGFGTNFFDYDNDGDLDLYVANGHIVDNIPLFNDALSYAQRDFLLENTGTGRFKDVGRKHGAYFSKAFVGRGMALADIDADGDLDVVVSNNDQAAVLLRNDGGNAKHYLRLRLRGTRSNRDGIGAKVIVTAAGRKQVEELRSGTSYLSQNELVLHFGLGAAGRADQVEIRWPSGTRQLLRDVAADRTISIEESSAR
ncbi:MAG TPA: CRTAC1 family protein [Candidatus Polarisedimenticolia bacterium]|nr:CRTAC1 family protein [Candidatus Polarisedimenticolia bacterium]